MRWRVIGLEAHDAYYNMAADEAIGEAVRSGSADPTMRFYTWGPSAVSIGHFQSMREEVDLERCRELGIDCVRRKTGGGAVYHDAAGELTYSVIAREDMFPGNIIESYSVICGWIIAALAKLNVAAAFAPINDIVVDGKKISGNAQSRQGGILTQHGTILYDLNLETMFSVLNVSREKISDKLIKSAKERVTRVLDYADASRAELYRALLGSFTEGKDYHSGSLSGDELRRAAELAHTVYRTDAWNLMR
jgi:lipoate-protein ligase A